MVDDEQDEDDVVAQLIGETVPTDGQFEVPADDEFLQTGGTVPIRSQSASRATRSRISASERDQVAAPKRLVT